LVAQALRLKPATATAAAKGSFETIVLSKAISGPLDYSLDGAIPGSGPEFKPELARSHSVAT
jgi:hypothetical protein